MKSRRELLSGLLIDLAKSVFIIMVMGKLINPEFISILIAISSMICVIVLTVITVYIHPKSEIDKELNL
jgi:hypothetical protein